SFDHPILIRIRATGRESSEPERPWLVTEYFEGITLAEQVARNGPLPPEEWMQVAWPLARALQGLHARGLLHRSLRPGCILLRREKASDGLPRWKAKVLDATLSLKRSFIHATASLP